MVQALKKVAPSRPNTNELTPTVVVDVVCPVILSTNEFVQVPINQYDPLYLLADGVHYDILIEKPIGQIPNIGGGIPSTLSVIYNPFPYMTEEYIKRQISINKAVYMSTIYAIELSREEIEPLPDIPIRGMSKSRSDMTRPSDMSTEQPLNPIEVPIDMKTLSGTAFNPGSVYDQTDKMYTKGKPTKSIIMRCLSTGI